ncbi:hypothetical protein [Rosistilla oblonga]|uniref:Uncharacterized protein n=1 Tax=Rosistilla oblonga TaxID=2527990 RepID=A0A518IM19_9BACT|nr:hypothetical protein [Rosistilla oblonga]QDV54127.1 hypothetical protein Mal33_00710 [Rosistilla oblonga]
MSESELPPVLEELASINMAYSYLGSEKDFRNVEDEKNCFCRHAAGLLLLSEHDNTIGNQLQSRIQGKITDAKREFLRLASDIESSVDPDKPRPNNFNFAAVRDTHRRKAEQIVEKFLSETLTARTILRVNEFESQCNPATVANITRDMRRRSAELERSIEEARQGTEKIEAMLADLGDKIEKKTIEDAADDFKKLASGHRSHECFWSVSLVITAIGFCLAIFKSYTSIGDLAGDSVQHVGGVTAAIAGTRNLLLLSLAGIGMRISLTKYNVERNMRVIYDHRETALSQYNLLKDRLDGDAEAQRQLLLEVTRLLFSDPATGLTKLPDEVNVNPVLNVVSKALGT